jgi:hypothetical protein
LTGANHVYHDYAIQPTPDTRPGRIEPDLLFLITGLMMGLGRPADVQAGGGGLDWYVSTLVSNTM